jgi:hypothetical protein
MNAHPAKVGDRMLDQVEDAEAIREGSTIPSIACGKPLVGSMLFDAGYLSPYFVTEPERMQAAFETFAFWSTKERSPPGKICSGYWSRLQRAASRC